MTKKKNLAYRKKLSIAMLSVMLIGLVFTTQMLIQGDLIGLIMQNLAGEQHIIEEPFVHDEPVTKYNVKFAVDFYDDFLYQHPVSFSEVLYLSVTGQHDGFTFTTSAAFEFPDDTFEGNWIFGAPKVSWHEGQHVTFSFDSRNSEFYMYESPSHVITVEHQSNFLLMSKLYDIPAGQLYISWVRE